MTAYEQYGSLPNLEAGFPQWKRRSVNLQAAFVAFLVPWILFCITFVAGSLLPFYYPALNMVILGTCALLLMCVFLYAVGSCNQMAMPSAVSSNRSADTLWYSFNVTMCCVAIVLGVLLGRYDYQHNLLPYFIVTGLNTYRAVNPLLSKGQTVMDGGRLEFTEDSVLDLPHAMGFRGNDIYCVSPISVRGANATSPAPLPSYDFWAVGINCCDGPSGQKFRCGQWDNLNAHGGLRLLHEDQTPYFRLAVQQAEAAYNIKSVYPIFLQWMEDPIGETDSYLNNGLAFVFSGIFMSGLICFGITATMVLFLGKFAD